jgi:hypothetical protein
MNDFKAVMLKDVKPGEFVSRKPNTNTVYTRAEYNRELKKYCLNDYNDISRCMYLKGSTIVYIDFTY